MVKTLFGILPVLVVAIIVVFSCWYVVDTGNVSVEKTLGTVESAEVPAGLNWKLPLPTSVFEFSAKEIVIIINGLTPKARIACASRIWTSASTSAFGPTVWRK